MKSLFSAITAHQRWRYILVLVSFVAINISALLFRVWQLDRSEIDVTAVFIFCFFTVVVQLPYILDICLVLQKKQTSAFGLYMVIMSMNLLVLTGIFWFLVVLILFLIDSGGAGLGGLTFVVMLGIGSLVGVAISGYGLPLLILLQPIVILLLTPLIPRFIQPRTGKIQLQNSRWLMDHRRVLQILPWIHPSLFDYRVAVVWSGTMVAFAVVGVIFYVFGASFLVPMNSVYWDSWMFS